VVVLTVFDGVGVTATIWTPHFSLLLLLVYEACYNPTSFWEPYFHLLPLQFNGEQWSAAVGAGPCVRVCVCVCVTAHRGVALARAHMPYAGHPNWMSPADISFAHNVRVLKNEMVQEPSMALTQFYNNDVFSKYPLLFGVDSPERRVRWAAELRWAHTVVATRAYSPRFESDGITLIPLLDLFNHRNDRGSFSHHVVASPTESTTITAYGKLAQMSYAAVSAVARDICEGVGLEELAYGVAGR
jgi:hypothetical protein